VSVHAQGEKDVQNLNEDFYASFGFEKYDRETDKVADTRAQLPTLEEQREEEANKRGWFDPRFSRRWDAPRQAQQQQPQEEVKKAPAAQQPAAEKKPEAEAPKKSEAPKAVEAPKKSEAPKAVEAPKKSEAPKAVEEAPKKSEEKKVEEAPKSDSNKATEAVPAPEKFKQWPSLEQERESDANSRGWFDPRYSQKWKWNSAYAQGKKPAKVSA
jgi:outer membrane biosynthesis protein TonB